MLNLHRQDLVKAYRANAHAKSRKYREKQKVVKKWLVLARAWRICLELKSKFAEMIIVERMKSK